MNTNANGSPNRDDSGSHEKNDNAHRLHPEHESLSGINEDYSGDNIPEEHREARHHHQEHGNRKYEAFRNHSSADDQPQTNTGTTP
ncbi:hypothetical protein [Flavobacterium sp. 3HN19-14]|uniref:hypothetical protein n=1 Tax=Flavobacterium sp. 3HN19-14 TaxID=3448133 RepID=UPI003EE1C0FC